MPLTRVSSSVIKDGTIATGHIADNSVTTAKIAAGAVVTVDIADSAVTTAKLAPSVIFVPAGAVMPFAMNSAPSGWLKANGAAVSRTAYSSLFSAIGTTYGTGDGTSTFNLPDLRGEFVRGWDDTRGVDASRAIGSAQADAYGSHTHAINDPGHAHATTVTTGPGGSNYGNNYAAGLYSAVGPVTFNSNASLTGISASASGGTETRPRNVSLLYCIKF